MRLRLEVRRNGRLALGGFELPLSRGFQTGLAIVFAIPFGLISLIIFLIAVFVGLGGDVYGALQALIFGLIIAAIGFTPLIWLCWARRRAGERETYDTEPWRKRESWRTNTLKEDAEGRVREVFFAGLWNAISWPVAVSVTIWKEPASMLLWGVWLFPIIGLLVLGRALLPTWQRWRYGRRVFEMNTYPGRVGSTLRGVVRSELQDETLLNELFTVQLGCYRRYLRRTRDRDGTTRGRVHHDQLWSTTQRVHGRETSGNLGLEIPIEIDLPPGLEAASVRKYENRIVWRLDVKAERRGVDFKARFDIPVMEAVQDTKLSAAGKQSAGFQAAEPAGNAPTEVVENPASMPGANSAMLKSKYGEEPWLHRKAWTTPRIAPDRKHEKEGRWLILFGSMWLAMTAGMAYLSASGVGEGGGAALFIIFAVLGLVVLSIGAYRVLRSRKYRHVMLELDEVPGTLGGIISGRLETDISAADHPEDGFSVKFSCYRQSVRRDSEGKKSVDYTLLWRNETEMQARPYGGEHHLAVPFYFRIPPDLPESTPVARPNRIAWKIEIGARMPGIDFASAVEVPVFVVDRRSRADYHKANGEAAQPASEAFRPGVQEPKLRDNPYAESEVRRALTAPVSPGIQMRQTTGGGTEFYFGPARHKGAALMLTGIFVVMATLTPVALFSGGVIGAIILLVFTVVTGYGAFHYWTHASRVTIGRGVIRVRSGPFARGREKLLSCSGLDRVEVATRADGKYDLQLVRRDMSESQLASTRQEKIDRAEWLEGWLRDIGLIGQRDQSDGFLAENLKQHGMLGDTIKAAEALSDRREAEWIGARIEELAAMQD